jgi:Na+-driven multidrug efflux pump
MNSESNRFPGRDPIGRLMRKYAVPCIVSLLAGALYHIVDRIFIANAYCLGSSGSAANTVVFPMTVAALAPTVTAGDGCDAFVSSRLGQKMTSCARKNVENAAVLAAAVSLILPAHT